MRAALRLAIGIGVVGACNPYDSDFGATPFLCGASEPRCPSGYTCLEDNGREVCYEDGSQSGDANCGTDNGLEPNSSLAEATVTGLDTMGTFASEGLAICPGVDKDNFAVALRTPNEGLEVIVDIQPAETAIRAAILNEAGIPIMSATPVSGMAGTIRARVQNLPATNYIVQVGGSGGSLGTHSYRVTINVTPPP